MVCNKCNHKLPDDSEFCQYCGAKIEPITDEVDSSVVAPDEALNAILRIQAEETIGSMNATATSQPNNEDDEDF